MMTTKEWGPLPWTKSLFCNDWNANHGDTMVTPEDFLRKVRYLRERMVKFQLERDASVD